MPLGPSCTSNLKLVSKFSLIPITVLDLSHSNQTPNIITKKQNTHSPGIQDITAWIDFSAVAGAAVSNDMDIVGYVTQSQFLMAGGLQDEMENFAELPLQKQLELSGQIKTLTLPGEMGENFKCIALGRGEVPTPSAFHHDDRTRTL